jgi:hypothetical protein
MLRGHWLPVPRRREKRGGKRQRESLVVSHGRPVRSRGLHPLPTCQNEGYPRSLYHPNLTPIMVKVWLPKGIPAAANAAAGPGDAGKQGLLRGRAAATRTVAPRKAKPPVCFCKRAALSSIRFFQAPCLSASRSLRTFSSALRLTILGRRRTRPLLRHEGVELFLVLGVTQAVEEIPEFGLLLLEAPQGLRAVFIEGAVAA